MSQISIESLDEGDELGSAETPRCCEAAMDTYPGGFQCGQCDSFVSYDRDRTVTHVEIT
ncbi:hypothetical protein GCM10009837_07200 [Streptomyces durmitorensis]|uniref:Uncharacterized protein n=1 Tax=Streptomyces durmitorensis TaxID=319947 RepID=A0ABY4PMQ1_9ACTN|nr:hypothetical protein [Streptomyces durmitorensis]UQT54387.1 hypothetical protein M4V62_04390 [Streptomyces durmitorensis]